jgi:hypothetical protein
MAEHPAPSPAKEPAAAETAFIVSQAASARPSSAGRTVVMPLAAPMIVLMMSKHEIYPKVLSMIEFYDISKDRIRQEETPKNPPARQTERAGIF